MPATALSSADSSAEAGILLSVLRAASSGNDVSHMLPELLQATLSRPAANAHVRKLAYEVCRHANLAEADYSRLWESITSDVNSSDPEVVAAAVRVLTCLPASHLADRLIIGQLSELMKPRLTAEAAVVRAVAVQALSHVLLLHEVQQAAASSAGLANTYEGLWDELTDSLLDERPFVVGQAAAATAQLLACGIPGGATAFSGVSDAGARTAAEAGDSGSLTAFMMTRLAERAALRLSAALGPVMEVCGLVPSPGQVAVCDMLLALTRRMLIQTLRASAAGAAAPAPPSGVPVPSLTSLVSSVASYFATQLQSSDPSARTEACGAVLEIAADLAAAGPAAAGAAAGLPQGLILGAVDALMQLREREFMEAGLGDICEVLVDALPALLPAARADVLRRLWPLTSRIDDLSRRARVFLAAWRAAVSSEMDFRTGSARQASGASGLPPPALPAAPSSAGSNPLEALAALAGPPMATSVGAGARTETAAGVVTMVPSSCRVVALLGEPYVCVVLSGKAPVAESSGAFSAAQASAAAASAPSSSSLLSMASMTRVAPPPPPLSLQRDDSVRSSQSGTPMDSVKAPSKTEKERKGVFGGRFFRSKVKGRGEADGDHASAAAAAHEEAAAAKQDEEAAAAAATAATAAAQRAAAATPPSPKLPPSPNTGNGVSPTGALSGSSAADFGAAVMGRPPPSLRHELLQCLLHELAHHPAAAVAAELCVQHAAAARHDRPPPTHPSSSTSVAALSKRLGDAVQWVALASEVLSGSATCVGWEPYVLPAITANPGISTAASAPVDFNSLTADLWLGLLQAALQAACAAQALLGRLVAEVVEVEAAAAAAGGGQASLFAGLGYGMPYGMAAGGIAAQQTPAEVTAEAHYRALLAYLQERADVLQGLLLKLLSGWSGLSASVRPRVAWVATQCLPLPGHWNEQWKLLLACLDALLVRDTDVLMASRRHDLLGSALAGGLFKAGRQAWTDPSKPFLFDIASASALCEAPEYEALGLMAALSALQHLAARLVNAVADAVPHGEAGAAHSQAVAVATRLEAVMRRFIATELAAAPHVRDWCKRILRYVTTLMTFVPPLNLPPTVAALGVIAKQTHEADGTGAAADDDDDSSDTSSVYQPPDGQAELPPALAAAAAAAAAAQAQGAAASAAAATVANGDGEGAAGGGATTATDDAAKQRNAAGNSYLVHSPSTALPMWGYPFAALSAVALHTSKRARRHRTLSHHLNVAAAAAAAPRPVLAAALRPLHPPEDDATAASSASPASGPALSCRSQFRLDREAFWSALPHSHSPWQELTGPADPLLLRGCYVRPDPSRGGEAAAITVMLSAVNRLPVEISNVEVALKTSGPLLSSSRRAAVWEVPRLAAHDRAVVSFAFKVLGYGDMQLHARLQLCPGPPRIDSSPLQLVCLPLEVPPAVLIRPPKLLTEAADFFKAWSAMPARTELPGVCTWPGQEGGALLMSALLRQPLGCAWLQHVPAVCGFQAAFAADTAAGDSLALVVMTQLMPSSAPGGSAESFCTFSLRSSSSDLILSLQSGAAAWLSQLTTGTVSLGGAGRAAQLAPSAKPLLHPRVAALLQSYSASAAQLQSAQLAPMTSFGLSATAAGAAAAGPDAAARGGVLNTVLLKNVALQEWQRLSRLAV